ncbi:hypothetical protein KJ782_04675 [Patescibacteria group bacterium]|nr:hypothetical protein [Patescibacteria group bacterium]
MLSVLFFAAIILLGATYLVQVNRTATSGFAVNDLNRKISELKENNQKLELEIADLQSLQNIQESSERLKLVAHTKLEYIQPSEGVVALEQ